MHHGFLPNSLLNTRIPPLYAFMVLLPYLMLVIVERDNI